MLSLLCLADGIAHFVSPTWCVAKMANLDILTVRQCELAGGRRVFVIIHSPVAAYGMLTARPMSANCAYSETEMFANHGKLASIDPSRVSVAMWQCYSEPRRKPLDEKRLHAQSKHCHGGNVIWQCDSFDTIGKFAR